jgi:hypothetical protein
MAEQCYIKKESAQLLCGVHNVRLVQKRSSKEPRLAGLGNFKYLICPVSGRVPNDAATKPQPR